MATRRQSTTLSPSGQLKASLEEKQSSAEDDTTHTASATWTSSRQDVYQLWEKSCQKYTCPARGQQCNYCLKFDHFATVFRSKLRDSKRNVHEVIDSAPNGSDLYLSPLENLFIDFDKSKIQAFAKIQLGSKSKTVSMRIDSGSQVNILTRSIFQSLAKATDSIWRWKSYDRRLHKARLYLQ